jgi:hypothetical protein
MRVLTRGRFTEVRSTSAGALVAARLETLDTASGETLVETWTTSIYRGVAVEGEDRRSGQAPELPTGAGGAGGRDDAGANVVSGSSSAEVSVGIDLPRTFPHVYTECASIWNPIHTELQVARAAGLPDILVHGTATWALAGREVLRVHAPGEPGRLRRLAARFRAMVPAGTPIDVRIGAPRAVPAATSRAAIPFRVLDASGAIAADGGWAVVGDAKASNRSAPLC